MLGKTAESTTKIFDISLIDELWYLMEVWGLPMHSQTKQNSTGVAYFVNEWCGNIVKCSNKYNNHF